MMHMERALTDLDATDLTLPKLEQLAILIYESMSICTRNYHSVQHIFDIVEGGGGTDDDDVDESKAADGGGGSAGHPPTDSGSSSSSSLSNNNPVAVLAACYHDCIYYHVDGGLTENQARILEGTYGPPTRLDCNIGTSLNGSPSSSSLSLHPQHDHHLHQTQYKFFATSNTATSSAASSTPENGTINDEDNRSGPREHSNNLCLLQMVESIFGYTPGQPICITKDGLNEFLSAVIAVRQLKDHLPMPILAQIACCIEATIPFRKKSELGGVCHPMDRLYENMRLTRDRFPSLRYAMSDDDLVIAVQRACLLSNRDVGNFGTTDRHWFLDNTWSLLPETNESLRNEYVYSVRQFHTALYKMYGFFGFLDPTVIFQSFRGVPSPDDVEKLTEECGKNLQFGKKYVGAKLLAMSVVAALGVLTGGDDAPLSLFTGDLRTMPDHRRRRTSAIATDAAVGGLLSSAGPLDGDDDGNNQCATHYTNDPPPATVQRRFSHLSEPSAEALYKCTPLVYEILFKGRRTETSFDIKKSPFAAFLYGSLGDDGMDNILKHCTLYPMTEERAASLLKALPVPTVRAIAFDMADMALSRADAIRQVVAALGPEK